MATLHILPIDYADRTALEAVVAAVAFEFQLPTILARHPFSVHFAYDHRRKQYHSSHILLALNKLPLAQGDKIIAIVPYDLFIPILTFVFGEAQLNGPTAVVSTFRLRPEFYGLPPNPQLLQQRLIKETIHELGHTFGLHHCPLLNCVLNASTYVEEIELKSLHLCAKCREQFNLKRH